MLAAANTPVQSMLAESLDKNYGLTMSIVVAMGAIAFCVLAYLGADARHAKLGSESVAPPRSLSAIRQPTESASRTHRPNHLFVGSSEPETRQSLIARSIVVPELNLMRRERRISRLAWTQVNQRVNVRDQRTRFGQAREQYQKGAIR